MGIFRAGSSILLFILNFLIVMSEKFLLIAYYIILPCRGLTMITDFIMAVIFHRLIFWFLKEKILFIVARSRHGLLGISCKTHTKVLWVILLTLIYTINDIMYQLVQILKELIDIIDDRRGLPLDNYYICDYLSRIMLNVTMPLIDFLMALSFLYFCFYQTDNPNLNIKFEQ